MQEADISIYSHRTRIFSSPRAVHRIPYIRYKRPSDMSQPCCSCNESDMEHSDSEEQCYTLQKTLVEDFGFPEEQIASVCLSEVPTGAELDEFEVVFLVALNCRLAENASPIRTWNSRSVCYQTPGK